MTTPSIPSAPIFTAPITVRMAGITGTFG